MTGVLSNLIYHFRENPCLWNSNCRSYRDRYARDNAIQRIAVEMNMTVDEVKTKWRSTRNLYLRKKKIYEDELYKAANGTGEYIDVPSWPFYKSMEFINVNLKRHSNSMIPESSADYLQFECNGDSMDPHLIRNNHIKKEPESYLDDLSILSDDTPFKKRFASCSGRDLLSPSLLDKAYNTYDEKSLNSTRDQTFETLKLLPATTPRPRRKIPPAFLHHRYQSIADYFALALENMPETKALETLNKITTIVIDAQLDVANMRKALKREKAEQNNAVVVEGVSIDNGGGRVTNDVVKDVIVLSNLTPINTNDCLVLDNKENIEHKIDEEMKQLSTPQSI